MKLRTKIPFSIIAVLLVAFCFGCQPSVEQLAQRKADEESKRQELFEGKLGEYVEPAKPLDGLWGEAPESLSKPYIKGKIIVVNWRKDTDRDVSGKSFATLRQEGQDINEYSLETAEDFNLGELTANTPNEVGTVILYRCYAAGVSNMQWKDPATGQSWPLRYEQCVINVIDRNLAKAVGFKMYPAMNGGQFKSKYETVDRSDIKNYILSLPPR